MPYGITQCYLPPGRGDIPAPTPAEGYSIKRPRRDARLSWPSKPSEPYYASKKIVNQSSDFPVRRTGSYRHKKAQVYSEGNLTRFSASKTATVRNSLLDAKKNLSIARPVIPLATC